MGILSSYSRLSRMRKSAVIAAILILLYAIFGFFIAPSILKSVIVSGIAEQLGRNAILNELRVNPFALSITVRGFEMSEPNGEQFLGFEELYVNFQVSSIFRQAYTFNEIRLIAPRSRVEIFPDGSLNFSDLLASPQKAEPGPAQDNELPPVLIFRLEIEQGRLDFRDRSLRTPFEVDLFPIQITLINFTTRKESHNPYAFTATTGQGESLSWEGNFSVNPLHSQGRFALTSIKARTLWKYMQDQVHFEVTNGSIDLSSSYEMDAGGEAFHFELIDGALQLNGFTLAEKGDNKTLISVPIFSVKDIDIDLTNKQAVFGSINSSDAEFECRLSPNGTLNFQTLFAINDLEDEAGASTEIPDQSGDVNQPWQIRVNKLNLVNYGLTLEDRGPAKPVRVSLEPVNLNLKNFSNQRDSRAEVALALTVNKTGNVEVKGVAGIDPVSADLGLQVAHIALKPFQSYMDSVARLELVSGTVSLDGSLKYRCLGDGGPELRYKGGLSIDGFEAVNETRSQDFLKWDSLLFNGLAFDFKPNKLSISEIVARQPYARVIVWPDRTLNLTSVFSAHDKKSTDDAGSEAQATMPVSIDTVRIENGSANFADFSLKPNFATGIQQLNGTIQGLSSESLTRADVLIEGKVDKYAPVKIVGQINPLSEDAYTDLLVSFKNIELTTFAPYSGKFMGYTIEKGKMSLDLEYKLSKSVLIGENKIFMDQFTLGERVQSPDATSLPVRLAIALLKDRKGIIDIDLPVRGNLDDPEFSYGRIVIRALVNLITKIATSPFAALGRLMGIDGEELSFVEFDFGSAALGPKQVKKIDTLAKALYERPALRLEIEGAADSKHDWAALAEVQLINRLKNSKVRELRAAGLPAPARAEDISLSDDDFARLMIKAYVDTFGKQPESLFETEQKPSGKEKESVSGVSQPSQKPGTKPKQAPIEPEVLIARLKQCLVENMWVDESMLRGLAQNRAMRIKDYLIQQVKIPDESVFMLGVEIDAAVEGDAIRTNLTLSEK